MKLVNPPAIPAITPPVAPIGRDLLVIMPVSLMTCHATKASEIAPIRNRNTSGLAAENNSDASTTPGTDPIRMYFDSVQFHLRQYGRKDPASMSINKGNITPIATAGGKTSARIDAEANAAPDPNPPLDIPAKITAGIARAKKE